MTGAGTVVAASPELAGRLHSAPASGASSAAPMTLRRRIRAAVPLRRSSRRMDIGWLLYRLGCWRAGGQAVFAVKVMATPFMQ